MGRPRVGQDKLSSSNEAPQTNSPHPSSGKSIDKPAGRPGGTRLSWWISRDP